MQEDLMQWRMGRVERIQKSQSCSNGMLLPAYERGAATQRQPLLSEAQEAMPLTPYKRTYTEIEYRTQG